MSVVMERSFDNAAALWRQGAVCGSIEEALTKLQADGRDCAATLIAHTLAPAADRLDHEYGLVVPRYGDCVMGFWLHEEGPDANMADTGVGDDGADVVVSVGGSVISEHHAVRLNERRAIIDNAVWFPILGVHSSLMRVRVTRPGCQVTVVYALLATPVRRTLATGVNVLRSNASGRHLVVARGIAGEVDDEGLAELLQSCQHGAELVLRWHLADVWSSLASGPAG